MHSQYLHPFYFIFLTEPPTITKTTVIFPIPSLTVPFSHAFLHPWPSPLTPFLNTLTHFFPYDHRSKDITTTPSIMSSMELDVEWFIWWKFIGIHTKIHHGWSPTAEKSDTDNQLVASELEDEGEHDRASARIEEGNERKRNFMKVLITFL